MSGFLEFFAKMKHFDLPGLEISRGHEVCDVIIRSSRYFARYFKDPGLQAPPLLFFLFAAKCRRPASSSALSWRAPAACCRSNTLGCGLLRTCAVHSLRALQPSAALTDWPLA